MAKNRTPPPPTQQQVEKHWKGQEKSVFQAPHTRDPGVTIANEKGDVSRILDAARNGETVPAYKLRNGEEILEDPVARTSELILKARKLTAEQFNDLLASPLDKLIYLAEFGTMSDYQRAQVWQRIEKATFEKQQAVLAEQHRRHQRDQKKTDQMLKGISMQERIKVAEEKRAKAAGVADGQ